MGLLPGSPAPGQGCRVMMRGMPAPILLLDVDGVLNPFGAQAYGDHYVAHDLFPGEDPVHVARTHGDMIRRLATVFELAWATGWNDEANSLLAPLLEIAQLPVVTMPAIPFEPREKVPAVHAYAGDRPVAWIDDLHTAEGQAWAATRTAPTLLLSTTPSIGLTAEHVQTALAWAANLSG
jgi:hypothetical protein